MKPASEAAPQVTAEPKIICLSAINLFTGGPLMVAREFVLALDRFLGEREVRLLVLCHRTDLWADLKTDRITLIEFPWVRRSWLLRLGWEYGYVWVWSRNRQIDTWISLSDVTSNVRARRQFVYCHNPAPFYRGPSAWWEEPKLEVFRRFYSLVYRINARKNEALIVQQLWMRAGLAEITGVDPCRIIVARPVVTRQDGNSPKLRGGVISIVYPAVPRVFKNFEVLFDALRLVTPGTVRVVVTFDGTENRYARRIYAKYGDLRDVEFRGYLPRTEVEALYAGSDLLVFPSKLETWGLPLSEFRRYGRPILAADLGYAREVLAGYGQACFFDPDDPHRLADLIIRASRGEPLPFEPSDEVVDAQLANDWAELFRLMHF